MPQSNPEYIYCILGPVGSSRATCPAGDDYIIDAASAAFQTLTGSGASEVYFGRGPSPDAASHIWFAMLPDNKKIEIVSSYTPGQIIPDHIRAWQLLISEKLKNMSEAPPLA